MALAESYDSRGYGCLCYDGYSGSFCEIEQIDCQLGTNRLFFIDSVFLAAQVNYKSLQVCCLCIQT